MKMRIYIRNFLYALGQDITLYLLYFLLGWRYVMLVFIFILGFHLLF